MNHFAVQQKLTQHCKATIFQLKTFLKSKKKKEKRKSSKIRYFL